jgi:hypothetical protein
MLCPVPRRCGFSRNSGGYRQRWHMPCTFKNRKR